MSSIDNLNLDLNIDQFIAKISTIEADHSDASINQASTNTFAMMHLQILTYLKGIKSGMDIMLNELTAVKLELNEYKQLSRDNEAKIKRLEADNKAWKEKIEETEVRNRANTLVLSGPAIKISNNYSASQMRNDSIKNIKEIYNFNLKKDDVYNCQLMRTKDNKPNGQILLTINNAIAKNDLISAVIKKDKTKGVKLNICEFLTKRNANVLYQLRNLRKDYQGKLFSVFSRNGFIFYKLRKESNPIKISSQADIDKLKKNLEEQNGILVSDSEPQQINNSSQVSDNGTFSSAPKPQQPHCERPQGDKQVIPPSVPSQLQANQISNELENEADRETGQSQRRDTLRKYRTLTTKETKGKFNL